MADHTFVGRAPQLALLNAFLARAKARQPQVVFVAGEAGAGKSALVHEFVRRAEEADPQVVGAVGECNAQTGIGDAYLPFRQVLSALTGADEEKEQAAPESAAHSKRLKDIVRVSGETLLDLGPDLIGIFVPGVALAAKLATTAASKSKLAEKLAERFGKGETGNDPTGPAPALAQEKIFEEYTAVLAALAQSRTLILVLDDLHWADSASLNLLFHLARQLRETRVLLIGTYRPEDVALGRGGARHPLESIVNELKRYGGEIVIDLGAVRAGEGRTFVDGLVDAEPNRLDRAFRAEFYARTEGQPLFAVELLRNLKERGDLVRDAEGRWVQNGALDWEAFPARVEGVIEERIARVAEDLRETLRVASVIGYDFSAQVVARAEEAPERDVVKNLSRELEKRHHLVVEQGEARVGKQFLSLFRFSHMLFQQFLYNELGAGERRLLHGRVARVLEELYAGQLDEVTVQLARHYVEASENDKAIEYLTRAGDAAFRIYAETEAIGFYSRALELARRNGATPEQRLHLYSNLGRACELSDQIQRALDTYLEMEHVARTRQDRVLELASLVLRALLYTQPTQIYDESAYWQISDRALTLANELGDRAAQARILWTRSLLQDLTDHSADAVVSGEQAFEIARELGLRELAAFALNDLAKAYLSLGHVGRASAALEQVRPLWREFGNKPLLADALMFSASIKHLQGDFDQAISFAEEGRRTSQEIGNEVGQASNSGVLSTSLFERGEFERALELWKQTAPSAERSGNYFGMAVSNAYIGWVYALLGAFEASQVMLSGSRRALEHPLSASFRYWSLAVYARACIANDDLEEAGKAVEQIHNDAGGLHFGLSGLFRILAETHYALVKGEFEQVVREMDKFTASVREAGLRFVLGEGMYFQALGLRGLGEPNRAYEIMQQARAEADRLQARRVLWPILAALSEMEAERGHAAEAEALRLQAHAVVEFIAERSPAELRAGFLNLPDVRAVMGS